MGRTGYRLVPKFTSPDVCSIYIVFSNGNYRQIGQVLLPHDNQIMDNMECVQLICDALRKRIRKSV
jgi:hypothetical protein